MSIIKITEQDSLYTNIESKSTFAIAREINAEDRKVAIAVQKALPQIASLADKIITILQDGGRVFYIGAGTSGRLGVIDASEIPPTFGAPYDLFVGLIAGGDGAMRKAVEGAEDDKKGAYRDLKKYKVSKKDIVIGIAASGTTPYTVHGLKKCQKKGIMTGCITCNPGSPILMHANFPIVIVVGPEYITGSTRMKSALAQKQALTIISTASMAKMGTVEGNKMVCMRMSNAKLKDRGIRTIMEKTRMNRKHSTMLLKKHNYSIKDALAAFRS